MRWFGVILFTMWTGTAAAKEVCDTVNLSADPFEGDAVVKILGAGRALHLGPDGARIDIRFQKGGALDFPLAPGFTLEMLLEDGAKITLVSDREALPTQQVAASQYSASIYTVWVPSFPLTEEVVQALAASRLTTWRWDINGSFTQELGKGYVKRFQRDFACAATRMQR